MELTKAERLILLNQYRILEKLDPDEADACKEACDILQSGYALEYGTLVSHLDEDMPEAESREVRDILDMYRALKKACRELPEGTVNPRDVGFQGFDGNGETKYFAYATFLMETQGKWAESKEDPRNSHWPLLPWYRKMLQSWEESASKWDLTAEDATRILSHQD